MTIVQSVSHNEDVEKTMIAGLRGHVRVIHALMLRSVLAQFGHENMGFFWLVAEPMLLTCGIMLLWSLMKVGHSGEIGVVPFALTGYTFITLWRHIVMRSQRIIKSSAMVRYHRQVHNIDTLIAMTLTETVGVFSAFVVAVIPLVLLGWCDGVQDPLVVVGGFVFAAWFSFAFSLFLASISEISEAVHHIIPAVMYLTLPLTGTFFLVDWLPEKTQSVVVWSPLVNCIEMIRSGMFPPDVSTHWSALYLMCCCLVMTGIGLPLYIHVARRVDPT